MNPPVGGITLVAPAICVVCALYKVATLRPRRASPAQRCLGWLLVFCTFGIASTTPLIYRKIDAFTGLPNFAMLIAEASGMALTWPGRSLLLYQDHDVAVARAVSRRRLWWTPPVFGLLVLLWWVAGGPSDPAIAMDRASDPVVVAELSVAHATMLVGAASCGRWCWQYSSGKPRELKMALRTMAGSGTLGVLWVFYRWTFYAASLVGLPVHAWGNVLEVDLICLGTATTTFALSSTLPDWSSRTRRALTAAVALRRLQPLWADLVEVVPEVRRSTPSRLHPSLRLHRRIVEIRDAQHVLGCRTPWRNAPGDWAVCDAEAQATGEAVRAARVGSRDGRPLSGAADVGSGETDALDLRAGLAAEVAWLVRVASLYLPISQESAMPRLSVGSPLGQAHAPRS